jgi:hypothetical protein
VDLRVLREESGGLRHYLAGQPVHAGDIIELQLHPEAAVDTASNDLRDVRFAGRYEWSCLQEDPPLFIIVAANGTKITRTLPACASFRWSRRFSKEGPTTLPMPEERRSS